VEDTVTRLTVRGLVALDDYERKALVKDLTVAFCAGRGESRRDGARAGEPGENAGAARPAIGMDMFNDQQ
jgi:hypothetical protein